MILDRRWNSAGVSSDQEDRRRHRVWWVVDWRRCRKLVLSEQVGLCRRWPACRCDRLLEFSPILCIILSIMVVVFRAWSAHHCNWCVARTLHSTNLAGVRCGHRDLVLLYHHHLRWVRTHYYLLRYHLWVHELRLYQLELTVCD